MCNNTNGGNMRKLTVPKEFEKYSDDELNTFLKRGRYDVEYRRARNVKLAEERKMIRSMKEDGIDILGAHEEIAEYLRSKS